ncbi:uncharacterized protein gmnc [Genypterus blacodes]|uniref:uncharacterized protein gmnc n=1 Tax=Genypterus blacodes TaxID=154954 RepID=UPI003F76DB02
METLASVWAHDPCDLSDPCAKQHEPVSVWGTPCGFDSSPPAGVMWTQQLSPHIQRNKQLQDTLLQREEELARLQQENNKLREFLSSSFVRSLEEKAKRLRADGRMKLKRNVSQAGGGSAQSLSHLTLHSPRVSKRVCRNLTAEFCSDTSEVSMASETNLDLWVLRTLGLKDRDTIDPSTDSSSSAEFLSPSSSEYSLSSSVFDSAVTPPSCPSVFSCPSSTELTLNSSITSSSSVYTSPPTHNTGIYCQTSAPQTEYSYRAAECRDANMSLPTNASEPAVDHSLDPCFNFTATGLMGQYEANEAVISSFNTLTALQSPLSQSTHTSPFTPSTDRVHISSIPASPAERLALCTQLRNILGQRQDTIHISPTAERLRFSPVSASSPVPSQAWMSGGLCTPTKHCLSPDSPSVGSAASAQLPAIPQVPQTPQTPQIPQTPRGRTDLAFSMSLSSSSSVKTHSFPQGQAFVRKDTEGRWKFTWMPKQGH